MFNYIICSTQRSGSTIFSETLADVGEYGYPSEKLLFLEQHSNSASIKSIELKKMPIEMALREVKQDASTPNGVAGIKVMWSTMASLIKAHGESGTICRKTMSSINNNFGPVKYIFWRRGNKVKQAISHVYLRKTGIAHARTAKELELLAYKKKNIKISIQELYIEMERLFLHELMWKQFFLNNDIDPIVRVYEEFVSNKSELLNSFLRSLGNDQPYIESELNSQRGKLKRLSPNGQSDIENEFLEHIREHKTNSWLKLYDFDLEEYYR